MPKAQPAEEILDNLLDTAWETTRRKVAVERLHPGAFVRFRRLARTGPNSQTVAIVVFKPGAKDLDGYTIPYKELEKLAKQVPDAEVAKWYRRQAGSCYEPEPPDPGSS